MQEYAKKLEFEQAQKCKISLQALESMDTLQVVRDGVQWEYMVIQILEKYEHLYIGIIDISNSKIVSYENYEMQNLLEENTQTILKKVIEQKWVENKQRKWLVFILPEEKTYCPNQ